MNEISPHGRVKLLPLIVPAESLGEELARASRLRTVRISSLEAADLVMLGIGAFTPLSGFMGYDDWLGVCKDYCLASQGNLFWPIPITLSVSRELAGSLVIGEEIVCVEECDPTPIAMVRVQEKFRLDKALQCRTIYQTEDPNHPGVARIYGSGDVCIGGTVRVLSSGAFSARYPGIFQTPEFTRSEFARRKWNTIAALQLRNPMHRSHHHLAKIAGEICDGVYLHHTLGALKEGDLPPEVSISATSEVIKHYLSSQQVLQGGYPFAMRYAGPREALLHGVFRQNYGCTHLVIGRDHAGVGDYYGPYAAQDAYRGLPADALAIKPIFVGWTFYCYGCGGMATIDTCQHPDPAVFDKAGNLVSGSRLIISGSKLRKMLNDGDTVPAEFAHQEALEILKRYYQRVLPKAYIELSGISTGESLTQGSTKL